MDEQKDNVAILLSQMKDLRNPAIGEAFAKFRSIPFQDAIIQAKKGWGIIATDLASTEADRLKGMLADKGVPSMVVSMASIAALPSAITVKTISLDTHGLVAKISGKPDIAVEWPTIQLLSAGLYSEIHRTVTTKEEGPDPGAKILRAGIFLTTGIPLPGGKKKKIQETKEEHELAFFLDVFFIHPMARIRIEGNTFDYSFLKEKREAGAYTNFRQLLKDIAPHSGNALQNSGFQTIVQDRPIRTLGYQTADDVERESRWVLTLLSKIT